MIFRLLTRLIYKLLDRTTYLKVKLLDFNSKEPVKADKGSAGYDVFATMKVVVPVGSRALIPLGISTEIPDYCYIRVAPRSGTSLKGIDVGAGVIDSSYRGEIKVLLINNSKNDYEVNVGDKIAQLILERCSNSKVQVVKILTDTERGSGGFGSTRNTWESGNNIINQITSIKLPMISNEDLESLNIR